MTEPTLLHQVVEANRCFCAGTPQNLDPGGEPFLVVACIDPRLTGLLEQALGLPRNRAVVIRTAGNQISTRNGDVMRSIAVALYVKQAREILVVGHTDCGMAGFSVPAVVECFRQQGIPRDAFGNDDIREWFGAFTDIRANLRNSIENLRNSGLIPAGIKVHGVIVDTIQGNLEVVLDGNVTMPGAALPVIEKEAERPPERTMKRATRSESPEPLTEREDAPAPPPLPKSRKGPIIVQEPSSSPDEDQTASHPDSLLEAIQILREFVREERQNQQLQRFLGNLQIIWKREKSPHRILAELATVAEAYRTRHPELPGALSYLENAIKSGNIDRFGFGEFMRRFLD